MIDDPFAKRPPIATLVHPVVMHNVTLQRSLAESIGFLSRLRQSIVYSIRVRSKIGLDSERFDPGIPKGCLQVAPSRSRRDLSSKSDHQG
jgi:hypothetical protein